MTSLVQTSQAIASLSLTAVVVPTVDDDGFVCPSAIKHKKNAAVRQRQEKRRTEAAAEAEKNNVVSEEDFAAQASAMGSMNPDDDGLVDLSGEGDKVVVKGDFPSDSVLSQSDAGLAHDYCNEPTVTPSSHPKKSKKVKPAPPAKKPVTATPANHFAALETSDDEDVHED
jgi:hypothetical protein